MMKKTLYLFFLLLSVMSFSQDPTNRFAESEKDNSTLNSNKSIETEEEPPTQTLNGGNPADPIPVDDYLPLLVVAAVGIIIYKAYPRKNLVS